MRIAVTYDNGNIFQHFGRTENFKVYEVEDGKVVSSEVIGSDGQGHGALAGVLANNKIDVLICGGIGSGAQAALADAGVELCAGADGDCDAAVQAYLNGELTNTGSNCDHHDHHHEEGEGCGSHCGSGGCGSSCGGGCGGSIKAPEPIVGPNVGKEVAVHYRGTFNNGQQFDSSYDRGKTLDFTCGAGMMIRGFDRAVANMKVGEKVNVHLMPEEAYGPTNPDLIFTINVNELHGSETLEIGQSVCLYNQYGQEFSVTVIGKTADTITFDANHEMAGKELNFEIELVEIK